MWYVKLFATLYFLIAVGAVCFAAVAWPVALGGWWTILIPVILPFSLFGFALALDAADRWM